MRNEVCASFLRPAHGVVHRMRWDMAPGHAGWEVPCSGTAISKSGGVGPRRDFNAGMRIPNCELLQLAVLCVQSAVASIVGTALLEQVVQLGTPPPGHVIQPPAFSSDKRLAMSEEAPSLDVLGPDQDAFQTWFASLPQVCSGVGRGWDWLPAGCG